MTRSPVGPARGEAVRVRSSRASADDGATVALDDALLSGLAPDGGLYLPDRVPPLPDDWDAADGIGDLAARTLAPWWGDEASEVAPLLRDALSFPVPLRPISDGTYLLELFHGPTLAFKDVGARVMARLVSRALARRGGRATVLVATSGDTGSAVADGFAGVANVRVALLYPRGLVSDVQERQLTASRPNVRPFAVEGDFDACQRLVKAAFRDRDLQEVGLTSANSINVGRLLPQATYYLWADALARRDHGVREPLRFVVPSGNLGNLTAGLLAHDAGLPVARFLAAHNANRYLPDVLAGRRDRDQVAPTVRTVSNAMDVGAPSNAERLWARYGDRLRDHVDALSIDEAATYARMWRTWREEGVQVCPHTAVGLEALVRWRAAGEIGPAIVLATAHPAKFPAAFARATGSAPEPAEALEALRDVPTTVEPLVANDAALKRALLDDAGWSRVRTERA
ncbi:MAG: threonine synthase [Trueperaceae bacterium]